MKWGDINSRRTETRARARGGQRGQIRTNVLLRPIGSQIVEPRCGQPRSPQRAQPNPPDPFPVHFWSQHGRVGSGRTPCPRLWPTTLCGCPYQALIPGQSCRRFARILHPVGLPQHSGTVAERILPVTAAAPSMGPFVPQSPACAPAVPCQGMRLLHVFDTLALPLVTHTLLNAI